MLNQNTQQQLSFITIVFLIISLSFLATISVWGKPSRGAIGPEGGTVDAGHDSSLIIPEGALVEDIKITANSFDSAVPTDSAGIVAALNQSFSLLSAQLSYSEQLPTGADSSGEWVENKGVKRSLKNDNASVSTKITLILEHHNAGNGWDALRTVYVAFDFLANFESDLIAYLNGNSIGSVAYSTIQNYNDQVRSQLETVDLLYESSLTFEFSPHGTEFLIPVELMVPYSEVCISDDLFFYSPDGEIVEPTQLDYFIDEVNETYHFFLDHFSSYYYPRR